MLAWGHRRALAAVLAAAVAVGGLAPPACAVVFHAKDEALALAFPGSDRVEERTEHARRLGAAVLLEPREGPAGWRSVVSSAAGGEIAFWEPKR